VESSKHITDFFVQTLTILSVGSQITDNGARIFADVLKVNTVRQHYRRT